MEAKPEFSMALLIAKAQAIVIKISQEMYFVYFFGGKILVHADKEEHIQAHTWNGLFHDWQLSYRRPRNHKDQQS